MSGTPAFTVGLPVFVPPGRRAALRRGGTTRILRMVPEEGLEPPRCCQRQILSLLKTAILLE